MKKIALLTCLYSVIFWFILEGIALLIDMLLRPKFYTILLIMFLIGLFIYVTDFVAYKIRQKKTILTIIWTACLELALVIIAIFVLTFNFTISPLESISNNKLKFDYGFKTDTFEDYNLFYYRID